jgi:hypothetical protein
MELYILNVVRALALVILFFSAADAG